jgi:hypothetical protein
MGTSAGCCFRLKIGRWTLEWGVEAGYATIAEERCGRGAPAITASMEKKKLHVLLLSEGRDSSSCCCCYCCCYYEFLSSVVGTGRHISKNTSKVDL